MQMGRYEEADRIYQKIIDLNFTGEGADRSLAEAWRGRGDALARLGKYNESLQVFDIAIELNAENAPYAWTGKSDALKDAGRYDEAIKAYDLALELYPEYEDAGIARAQKGRGDALSRQGKSDEALAAYEAAVKASDEAISAFNNATPLDRAVSFTFDPYPLDGEFWHNRAFALHSIGREAEAEESSAKATEMGYRPKMVTAVAGSGPVVAIAIENGPEAEETGPRR
jgi:tetratricopeptide (TPR) repeat protein